MRCLGMMALAAAVTFACTDARSNEFWTGNDLLAKMQSTLVSDQAQALGYVMGALDMGQSVTFCTPQVTAGQLRDIIKQHLESVPTARHLVASAHINYALRNLWPCQQRTPTPNSRSM